MTPLESLFAAIDALRAAEDRGSTHWQGCEAVHPRCVVYRAADAARADGLSCRWAYDHDGDYYETGCGRAFCLTDGTVEDNEYRFCPSCGRLVVEDKGVSDG